MIDLRSARAWLAETLDALAGKIRPSTAVEQPGDTVRTPEDRLHTVEELRRRGLVPLDEARERLREDAEQW